MENKMSQVKLNDLEVRNIQRNNKSSYKQFDFVYEH